METGEGINNPLVKQALNDLSARLGIGPDAITLVSAESVAWPDGSLGCPRSDMGYKQVQQDGMRIIFKAQGRTFEYHSGGSRPPLSAWAYAPEMRSFDRPSSFSTTVYSSPILYT